MIAFMIIHFFILTFETIKSNQYKVLTELLVVWSDYGGQKFFGSWHDFPADKVVQGSAAASLTDKVRIPVTLISYRSFAKPLTSGDLIRVRKEVTWVGWPQWHLRPPACLQCSHFCDGSGGRKKHVGIGELYRGARMWFQVQIASGLTWSLVVEMGKSFPEAHRISRGEPCLLLCHIQCFQDFSYTRASFILYPPQCSLSRWEDPAV